jgi:predicted nucleic acid-binding Zn ribbon protein
VTRRPDPTVIPNQQDFTTAISADLSTWMNTLARRAAA